MESTHVGCLSPENLFDDATFPQILVTLLRTGNTQGNKVSPKDQMMMTVLEMVFFSFGSI